MIRGWSQIPLLGNPGQQLLGDLMNDILGCPVLSSCLPVKPQGVALDRGPTGAAEPGAAAGTRSSVPKEQVSFFC